MEGYGTSGAMRAQSLREAAAHAGPIAGALGTANLAGAEAASPMAERLEQIDRGLTVLAQLTEAIELRLSPVLIAHGPNTQEQESPAPAPTSLLNALDTLDRRLRERCQALASINNRIVL